MIETFRFIADYEGDVPGATAKDCGNYLMMNLPMAKWESKKYLEEVLEQELTELGARNIEIGRRMVSFTGDKAMMYKANFCLRTAIRILKPIKHFTAKTADEVYEAVKSIAWENYLDNMSSFSVDAVVFSNEFRHSKFVAYKVKDAVVDYFR